MCDSNIRESESQWSSSNFDVVQLTLIILLQYSTDDAKSHNCLYKRYALWHEKQVRDYTLLLSMRVSTSPQQPYYLYYHKEKYVIGYSTTDQYYYFR